MNKDKENTPGEMSESRKNTLVKTIEIRLEGVRESSKRARLAFLVATIASAAILVTIWNAYFSWSRNFAFPEVPSEIRKQYDGDIPCAIYQQVVENELQKQKELPQQNSRFYLPLQEYNKRNAALEWVKTLSISINLLGIDVNVNDFAVIGSLSLITISLWFLFSVRRENRAIVTLLRDVYNETFFTPQDKGNNKWDIANLAFQGAAHSLIFISVGNDDRPMSEDNVFSDNPVYGKIDNIVARLTYLVRYLVVSLMLLPPLTILIIIYADYQSIDQCSPFRANFPQLGSVLFGNLDFIFQRDVLISLFLGFLTLIICVTSMVFQYRTTKALNSYATKLGLTDSRTPSL